ncbi:UNVERIFIED_CONTAM: Serine/threonine-protein kinase AtPK1/AtPK6 [Sesamum radiatum]|uniref:Serine/threonine-protein kinase AtPK1/AtPK6 n=1 Tax=Sesamum radiatum TaxID=300843 RepID=A0AAW2PIB8_SESRA
MNDNATLSSSSSCSASYQKKAFHSMLASRLTHLHIPQSTSAAEDPSQDFDFSDLFGPAASSPSSSSSLFLGDPQVIHHRSHSFVGPSPRFTLSKSLPTFEQDEREELYYSSSDDTANNDVKDESHEESCGSVCGGDGINGVVENGGIEGVKKVGPADFEIMRVIGKGAFGKVFQVRMKGRSGGGDGMVMVMGFLQ